MNTLIKEMNAMYVLRNFCRSLWGSMCVCMAYGFFPRQGDKVKCALPGCNKKTTHRGGYCCPEHKEKHKELVNGMRRSK